MAVYDATENTPWSNTSCSGTISLYDSFIIASGFPCGLLVCFHCSVGNCSLLNWKVYQFQAYFHLSKNRNDITAIVVGVIKIVCIIKL